ncbi:RecX family transcriptional regulator [Clostridia bacterium]|nr:RecX family transcriptional regulator [Clostridia bacterium]
MKNPKKNPKKKPRKKRQPADISALHKAVSLLARRSYGIQEMRRKLTGASYPQEEIEEVVNRLVEAGYLDDRSYARAYVRDQMNLRRKGPRLIQAELAAKKVDSEIIMEILSEQYTEAVQQKNISCLIDKWRSSSSKYTDQQMMRKLIQKGYYPGLAIRAVKESFGEQGFLDTP